MKIVWGTCRKWGQGHVSISSVSGLSFTQSLNPPLFLLFLFFIATDKRGYPHNIFLISLRKHMLLYSLEVPRRGASNEYPHHLFLLRNKKDISIFRIYLLLCFFTSSSVFYSPFLWGLTQNDTQGLTCR